MKSDLNIARPMGRVFEPYWSTTLDYLLIFKSYASPVAIDSSLIDKCSEPVISASLTNAVRPQAATLPWLVILATFSNWRIRLMSRYESSNLL